MPVDYRSLVVHDVVPEAVLVDAAETMTFYAIGALPVVEEGVLVGILSERDVVRAVAEQADLGVTAVSEYMTPGRSRSPRATPSIGPGS